MKKVKIVLGVSVIAFGTMILGDTAFAKDTTGEVAYTSGSLTLDPEVDPDEPLEPGDSAYSLPTNLNFGSHEIQTKKDEKWVATEDGDQTKAPTIGTVRIQDNRGEQPGWAVKVKQSAQFTSANSDKPLTGAELRIEVDPTVRNNLGDTTGISGAPSIVFDAFAEDKLVFLKD